LIFDALSATSTPSSMRQLASPTGAKWSVFLPSNSATQPPDWAEVCCEKPKAARPATSAAAAMAADQRGMVRFSLCFDGRDWPRRFGGRNDSKVFNQESQPRHARECGHPRLAASE